MADIAKSTNQNILPVQALFNVDGTFNTFIGQGQPFYVMGTETISITNTSVNANLYPTFTTATSGGVTGLSVSSSAITFNPGTATLTTTNFAGSLTGTASSATNLAGGVSGQIPYQSASGTTSFVTNSISGYVLTSNGSSAPTWQPATGGLTIASVSGATTYYPSFATSIGPTSTGYIDTSNLTYTSGVLTGVYAGTWQGSAIGSTYGGTGFSTYATGDLIYASATNTLSKLAASTNGYVLTLSAGVPTWAASSGGVTSFSAGTTGFTPNTATTGAITLSGTLNVANGGTGVTSSSGANSVVLRDANGNITTNCLFEGYVTQAASGTTIVLTASTAQNYQITGSGGQIIRLPSATTLPNGATFTFNNNQSSGAITVQNNSSTTIATINSGGYVTVVLLDNSTAAGSWDRHDSTPSNVSWSTNTLNYPGSITGSTWNATAIGAIYGGTGQSTYATGDILYASAANTLSKLSVGTNGYVLTLASGVPTWAASTGGVTSITGTANQITASASTGAVTLSMPASVTTGQYIANQVTSGSSTQGAFAYGTMGYSDVNRILSMQANQNSYAQMEIQNTNTGSSASSDVVVGNNNTTATTYYGDFGMNSSGWAGTGAFVAPNNVYLTATTADLALGTTTANSIRFAVNGNTTDAMTINSFGAIAVNGSYGTAGQILTTQGSSAAPTWTSASTASYTRTSFTATVGQTTFSVTYTAPYIAVYQNGTLLNASDYTASNGTTVVLAIGASTGDIIETIAYNVVAIGSAAGSNTQVQYNNSGALGANANFTYTGNDLNIPFGASNSATSSAKIALALSMIA